MGYIMKCDLTSNLMIDIIYPKSLIDLVVEEVGT